MVSLNLIVMKKYRLLVIIISFAFSAKSNQNEIVTSNVQTGKASFYSDYFVGRTTASGEIYMPDLLTAAHKTLPFGTKVKVTCKETSKSVIVIINDRGPYVGKRIIDLSKSAFQAINALRKGIIHVELEILPEPDLD